MGSPPLIPRRGMAANSSSSWNTATHAWYSDGVALQPLRPRVIGHLQPIRALRYWAAAGMLVRVQVKARRGAISSFLSNAVPEGPSMEHYFCVLLHRATDAADRKKRGQ
jgi:hypothetical protein